MTKRMSQRTRKAAARAYRDAEALGPLRPVEPHALGPDASPRTGPGQVYATRTGTVYHPRWCEIVGQKWDSDPQGLLVVMQAEVGKRRRCRQCDPLA